LHTLHIRIHLSIAVAEFAWQDLLLMRKFEIQLLKTVRQHQVAEQQMAE